jgi:hypothetical protein
MTHTRVYSREEKDINGPARLGATPKGSSSNNNYEGRQKDKQAGGRSEKGTRRNDETPPRLLQLIIVDCLNLTQKVDSSHSLMTVVSLSNLQNVCSFARARAVCSSHHSVNPHTREHEAETLWEAISY